MTSPVSKLALSQPATPTLHDVRLLRATPYIAGRWLSDANSAAGEYAVCDPASGRVILQIWRCGIDETQMAIDAAEIALPQWSATPTRERAALLRKLQQAVLSNAEDFAALITAESGKPISEARAEVAYAAAYFEWFAEQVKRIIGEVVPATGGDRRMLVLRQAVGVVACITPWNFPLAMLTRKIAPALAAGCTTVCKPSEETPLSAFALAELADRAQVPAGVINMVSGDAAAIGDALLASKVVRKVTFTGSTRVGKHLAAGSAATMKRTSMELGGNAPFLVFDDADIDAAVEGVMSAKFRNAGQTCISANRILVQRTIVSSFVTRLSDRITSLIVGLGSDPAVQLGPLIHHGAAVRVHSLGIDAVKHGATMLIGDHEPPAPETCFVRPMLLTGCTDRMRVWQEEIFGPIAAIGTFEDEAEAIATANATDQGLAAYVYTRSAARQWRVPEALQFGMVGINDAAISNEMAPFGGIKESGHGREGSVHGLDDYLEMKLLSIGGLAA